MPARAFCVSGVFGTATEVRGIPVRHFVYDCNEKKSLLIRRDAVSPTYCPWVTLQLKVRGDIDVPTCIHKVLRVHRTSISSEIGLDDALQHYLRNLAEENASQTFVYWRGCYPPMTTISRVQDLQLTIPKDATPDQARRVRALHDGILRNMHSLWLDVDEATRTADEKLLCYFGDGLLSALKPAQRRWMHEVFLVQGGKNLWRLFCWPFFLHALQPVLDDATVRTFHVDSMEFCYQEKRQCHQYRHGDPRATIDQAPTAWRKSVDGRHTEELIELISQQYQAQVLQGCDIYPLKNSLFAAPPYRALGNQWCCLNTDYLLVKACSEWLQRAAQNIWLYDTRRIYMFPEHSQYLLLEVLPEDTTHALLITTSATRSEMLSTNTALPWYALAGGQSVAVVAEGVTSIVIDNAHKTTLCEVVQWLQRHVRISDGGVRLYVCGDSLAFGCTYLRRQGNFFRDLLCVQSPALPFVVSRPSRGEHALSAHELQLLKTLYTKTPRDLCTFTVDAFNDNADDDDSNAKRALDIFTKQLLSLKSEQVRGNGGPNAREIDYQVVFLNETHCNSFLGWCQRHGFPRQQNQEMVGNAWIRCHAVVAVRSTGDCGKVGFVRSATPHDKKRPEIIKKRGLDCREGLVEIEFSRGKRRKGHTESLTIDCSKGEKIQPLFVQTLSLDDGRMHDYTFLQVPEDGTLDLRTVAIALSVTRTRLLFFGRQPRAALEKLCRSIERHALLQGMKMVYRGSLKSLKWAHGDLFAPLRDQQLQHHKEEISLFARLFASSFLLGSPG